ncbi:hypothetical protein Hdeb2414_s0008g00289051 [Helianthus debilis subsp. tardiflorus]
MGNLATEFINQKMLFCFSWHRYSSLDVGFGEKEGLNQGFMCCLKREIWSVKSDEYDLWNHEGKMFTLHYKVESVRQLQWRNMTSVLKRKKRRWKFKIKYRSWSLIAAYLLEQEAFIVTKSR